VSATEILPYRAFLTKSTVESALHELSRPRVAAPKEPHVVPECFSISWIAPLAWWASVVATHSWRLGAHLRRGLPRRGERRWAQHRSGWFGRQRPYGQCDELVGRVQGRPAHPQQRPARLAMGRVLAARAVEAEALETAARALAAEAAAPAAAARTPPP
jgi:hypothetical protein